MDLTEFIRARIDEDEAALDKSRSAPKGATRFVDADPWSEPLLWDMADEGRVEREIAAKRAILAQHGHGPYWQPGDELLDCQYRKWPCTTLRALAAVWSDHPDYRAQWAPES